MTKTEAIKAMLGEKVCVNNGFKLRFYHSVFQRKGLGGEWVADNLNLFQHTGWSIYTQPKKTEKRWLWLVKLSGTKYETGSACHYPNEDEARKDMPFDYEIIKPLDGTDGTWDSGIEVEI